MLFLTLNQHWIFLIILWYGCITGLCYRLGQSVCNTFKRRIVTKHLTRRQFAEKRKFTLNNSKKHRKTHKKRKFFKFYGKIVKDFLIAIVIFGVYLTVNILYNYGEVRLYTMLGFGLGLWLGCSLISLVAKLYCNFCKNRSKITRQIDI